MHYFAMRMLNLETKINHYFMHREMKDEHILVAQHLFYFLICTVNCCSLKAKALF